MIKRMGFFSVVIPVFNKDEHVERAINSVLCQSFEDFELLLICDPSTDSSTDKVEKIMDSRVKIFYRDEPGPGGYAARNLGIVNATADWVAFLDADDEWNRDHLQNLHEAIRQYPDVSFFASGYEIVNGNGKSNPIKIKVRQYFTKLSFEEYLTCSPFYTSAVCVKKDALLKAGLFPAGKMKRGGDVDTWLRVIEMAGSYLWINYIGAKYYRDAVNMVTKHNFYTEKEVANETLLNMISKYQGSINKKLKVKYNNQVIYAWNQNMHLSIPANFNLSGRLFIREQFLKSTIYISLSLVPLAISKPIHKFAYKLISRYRRYKNNM